MLLHMLVDDCRVSSLLHDGISWQLTLPVQCHAKLELEESVLSVYMLFAKEPLPEEQHSSQ